MSFLNDEQIDKISNAVFDKTDLDKNGQIDGVELSKIMRQIATEMKVPEPNDEIISNMMSFLDKDESGMLTRDEFRDFVVELLKTMY
jgi:Ca2+-binding EF-hand superfamily protein